VAGRQIVERSWHGRRIANGVALLTHALVCVSGIGSVAQAANVPVAVIPEQHREFFKTYCVDCHNEQTAEGNLRLDNVSFSLESVETAERWQKILNQLNSGDMPPEESGQPGHEEKIELLDVVAHALVAARRSLGDVGGRITMRRLNRREYKNTIRDLLNVELDVRDLPDDQGIGQFDTVGSSLFMSSDQLEQYLALGRKAIEIAFERNANSVERGGVSDRRTERRETEEWANRVIRSTYSGYYLGGYKNAMEWKAAGGSRPPSDFGLTDDVEANYRITSFQKYGPTFSAYLSNPLIDTGSLLTRFTVHTDEVLALPPDNSTDWNKTIRDPVKPGQYMLRIRIGALPEIPAERLYVEMGTRTNDVPFALQRCFQITGTVAKPQVIEFPVAITADGPRSFVFRERRAINLDWDIFHAEQKRIGVGLDPALWIDWVEWDGPLPTPVDEDVVHQLLASETEVASESDRARNAIEQLATRAFRGHKPEADFVDRLAAIFEMKRKSGDSFEDALMQPLSTVLASPGFLYLSEADIQEETPALDSYELAVRLSYFLWSGPPDEQLLALAKTNELQSPEVLGQQVDRMLGDDKAWEFITGFTHQWLGLERLDFFQFNTKVHRDFDDSTKAASRDEVFHTIKHWIDNDGSLRELLKSDVVVINSLLADYYGIEGVVGQEFRPVSLAAGSPRGGFLGMAAILAMGSNGDHSSPVERGVWVLRKLLHSPPPPAPPNVPQLTRLESKLLTNRERVLAHQEEPQCASCHRKIDPIGFGLENFNATGKWRTVDSYEKAGVGKKEWTIDPAGAFHNGPAFRDYFELRDLIAARQTDFARGYSEALIEYALGRPFGFSDEELSSHMVAHAEEHDLSMRQFIQALVASPAFRRK